MEMEVLFPEDVQGIPKPAFGEAKKIDIGQDTLEAAQFAVKKYNETHHCHLVLVSVCMAWRQISCGETRYYMILHCKDGGADKIIAAIVQRTISPVMTMHLALFKIIFA